MNSSTWTRARSVVAQTSELEGDEFEHRLDELCGSDQELRQMVLELLAAGDGAETVVEGPISRSSEELQGGHFVPGTTFSHYRIRELIDRGGMGEVYAAYQTGPIRREVALKVIKPGMDSRQVVARFEAERQALARMDHPNIARVFDAGTAPDARPFFAMEMVHGIPITRYCAEHRLDTDQRLALFVQVCGAVQHAHQKGVIHRDLKPSNILVTLSEDSDGPTPIPKIIDFGIAKALSSDHLLGATKQAAMTQIGQVVGTPDYMSPEQADAHESAVDTRTDVYSLGVVLYELLVGVVPIRLSDTTESTPNERARRLMDEEPVRPSNRLLQVDRAISDSRSPLSSGSETLRDLARRYRGDLDWIVLKALAKEQSHRYGGPAELAADLERYRSHQPVSARPPSRRYRMLKFARRHRASVATASAAVLALSVGAIGASFGLVQARKAEADALRQAERAQQAARTSEEVSNFLIDLFDSANPFSSVTAGVSAGELLEQGVEQLERTLANEPATKARLLRTVGGVYEGLGDFDEAVRLLEAAIALHTDPALNTETSDEALARAILTDTLVERGQLEAAVDEGQRAVEAGRSSGNSRALGAALTELASARVEVGDYENAEREFVEAIELLEQAEDSRRLIRARFAAVQSMLMQGDFPQAESEVRSVIEALEELYGPDHLGLGSAYMALGEITVRQERIEESGEALQLAHDLFERVLGEEHIAFIRARGSLAAHRLRNGQPEDARALLESGLQLIESHHPNNLQLAAIYNNDLGKAFEDLEDYGQARRYFERGIRLGMEHFGPRHPFVAFAYNNLGSVARKEGDLSEALRVHQQSLQLKREAFSDLHPTIISSLQNMALVYSDLDQADKAEATLREALELVDQLTPVPQGRKARLVLNLAALLEDGGRNEEAAQLRQQADNLNASNL